MLHPETTVVDLFRNSFRDPRGTIRHLIDRGYPADMLWQAILLLAILIVLTEQGLLLLAGGVPPMSDELAADPVAMLVWSAQALFYQNPIMVAALQSLFCITGALALYRVGRMAGGTGTLRGALTTMAWFLVIYLVLSVSTAIIAFVVPFIGGLVALAVFVANAWLATEFTCGLHGFRQPMLVFLGLIATGFLITLGVAVLASFFIGSLIGGI